jgi:hypothetical protein
MTRDGHDPRCERSATSRCRCVCQGRLHGVEATQIDLADAHATQPLTAGSTEAVADGADEGRARPAAEDAPQAGQQLTLGGVS